MTITPLEYYSGTAAAEVLEKPRATLNCFVSENRQTPDALLVSADKRKSDQPAWTQETLMAFKDNGYREVETGTPVKLYAASAAGAYTGFPAQTFTSYRKRLEIPADAWIIRSSTTPKKPLWTAGTLDRWVKEVNSTLKRRKPKGHHLFGPDDAALILSLTLGQFQAAVKTHPVAPDAMLISPASPAWYQSTLERWAKENHLGKWASGDHLEKEVEQV